MEGGKRSASVERKMVFDGVVALNNESSNDGRAEGGIEIAIDPLVAELSGTSSASSSAARSSISTPVILSPPARALLKLRIEVGLEPAR